MCGVSSFECGMEEELSRAHSALAIPHSALLVVTDSPREWGKGGPQKKPGEGNPPVRLVDRKPDTESALAALDQCQCAEAEQSGGRWLWHRLRHDPLSARCAG